MATAITTAAAMTLTNMKPQPDEAIDALWGQNLADNTGFLNFREILIPITPDPTGSQYQLFASFVKKSTHNFLRVAVRSASASSGAVTDVLNIKSEGQVLGGASVITASSAYTRGIYTTSTWEADISALVTGTRYMLALTVDSAKLMYCASVTMIHSAGATY